MTSPIIDRDRDGRIDGNEVVEALRREDAPGFTGPKHIHEILGVISREIGAPFGSLRDQLVAESPTEVPRLDRDIAEILNVSFNALLESTDPAIADFKRMFPNGSAISVTDVDDIAEHARGTVVIIPSPAPAPAPATPSTPRTIRT
ncbi:MAG: hypothetical protein J0M34_02425 [Alphaproteobacteria bacterium]|nr:hypothetical protein [Alphaproteobacteria bacterium]